MDNKIVFSIAHATARPNGWQRTFTEAIDSAENALETREYVLSVDERFGEFHFDGFGDPDKILKLDPTERKCAVSNWINAINGTTGDVIIVNSDDFSFPPYWDVGCWA
jgi:hypothetical protein